ncbi:heat shock protein grpE [Vibrio ishigakensis]|uniref:Heat shock protein grpE n=1 Tax=Vibrio ishigakensis TaxID=1481914 RepID=A0A0B8QCN4_9VIBR|nr:heat shock protein grpE [Vibrio ishigakensis]
MSDKDIKNEEQEVEQTIEEQVAEEVVAEQEADVIGDEGDVEWNEESAEDIEESKVAQLEAALLQTETRLKEQADSVLRAKAEVTTCVVVLNKKWRRLASLRSISLLKNCFQLSII